MELKGIDYFPFSINFFEDNKIALLEAEFGSDGVVVILKLLSRIYRGGFYCHWEDDDCLLFARKAMDGWRQKQSGDRCQSGGKRPFRQGELRTSRHPDIRRNTRTVFYGRRQAKKSAEQRNGLLVDRPFEI